MTLDARVPPSIVPALAHYLGLLSIGAPGLLSGFYLAGSIALGAFDERHSDVDFVAVLARRPGAADVALLRNIHRATRRACPRCKLEGSYLQAGDLGRAPALVPPYPYYGDGKLHPAGHHDLNPVTWWILKRHGIALSGPAAQTLDLAVDWAIRACRTCL